MDGEQKQKKLLAEAHPHEPPKENPAADEDEQKDEGKGKAKEA